MEFHQDDPAHEWRVLEDAAVRFPTAERRGSDDDDDNDEDETKISESTWAALFAMEHAERRQNQSKCNDEDDDDDDDEGSLDGGLGRLVPGNLSRTSSTNIATLFVSSETSLLSEDSDRSLNFSAPAAASLLSSSSCHPPVFFAGFHEGFRMNSDQSLGVQSAASSGSTVSIDDAASTRRGMGLSSVKCAGRRHLLTRRRNDEEEEKIDAVGGAASAWD